MTMSAKEIFRGAAKKMLVSFESTSSQFKQEGLRGEERANELRVFLAQHLPKRFFIGNGSAEIVAANGEHSGECDVIIYGAFYSPVLHNSAGNSIFLAESVYAVVEVSSQLDSRKFQNDFCKLQQVRNLPRESLLPFRTPLITQQVRELPPVITAMFAYDGFSLANATSVLRTGGSLRDVSQTLDLFCILRRGLVLINLDADQRLTRGDGKPTIYQSGEYCLGVFYLVLLSFLNSCISVPVNLVPYLDAAEIFGEGFALDDSCR